MMACGADAAGSLDHAEEGCPALAWSSGGPRSQSQVFVISNDGGYPEMFHPAADQSLCLAAIPPSASQPVTLQACNAMNSDQIWWYYHTDQLRLHQDRVHSVARGSQLWIDELPHAVRQGHGVVAQPVIGNIAV